LKDGLKVLKKVLDDSNLHTLNDSEHHQLTRLGGLYLPSEQCYFFNPNNQLCELTNQFYEKFDRGLDEFESAISYEYRKALDTFSSQKDEEILRCGTSYCYDNKMQITVAQLKSTYLDNLRKHYSKDVEFRNLLEKIESSPNLLGEDEIPKFLPNEWLDTFTYPEPKK
jgi:hypothetical protein